MYCTHTNDEFIEYAALTIQAHTNDQPNCRRYAVSDRSILLEVETDLTGAHYSIVVVAPSSSLPTFLPIRYYG